MVVVCACSTNVLFITLSACCGILGICCCSRGHYPPIPFYRRNNNVYPVLLLPPQSEMMQETRKIVLITNPYQSNMYIGFPNTVK